MIHFCYSYLKYLATCFNTSMFANISSNGQRLMKFANWSLYILRTEPSVAVTEDVLHWTFASFGLISNLILVSVILRSRRELLQFSSNILLLNLAIANLVFIITTVAVKIRSSIFQLDRASSSMVMKAASLVTEAQALLSNWTLAVLAIFSFYAVKAPLKFKVAVTRKKTMTIIGFIWVASISLAIPLIVITSPREVMLNGEVSSAYFARINADLVIGYALFLDCLSNIPAAVAIVLLYPLILVTLRRRYRRKERSQNYRKKIDHSIKRVAFIFISFFIYISLDIVVALSFQYFMTSDALDEHPSALTYSSLKFTTAVFIPFQLFHTILSPFIHALLTDNYRKYYLPLLCKFPTSGHNETLGFARSRNRNTDHSRSMDYQNRSSVM